MSFPEPCLTPPEDTLELAREEWESQVSLSEAMNPEDLDYVLEKVESGKFDGLQEFVKKIQDRAFQQWLKDTKQQNEEDIAASRWQMA